MLSRTLARCIASVLALLCSLVVACSGPPPQPVVVRMLYGSEKQTWIDESTQAFLATQPKTASGRPIQLQTVPIGSGEAMDAIVGGQDKPAVWSPASSLLLPVANQRWAATHSGAALIDDNPPQLVLSPIVIAMWRPMAESL